MMRATGLTAGILGLLAVPAFAELTAKQLPAPPPPPPPQEAPRAKPTSAEGPVFELKDGARIVGAFSQDSFRLETSYGALTIPAADILMIRFGTRSDPELGPRIEALVRGLGSADFAAREKATEQLERLGSVVRPAVQAVRESADAEVRERAERILEHLEESEEEPRPEEDEIVTARFTARGDLQCPLFRVKTQYGELTIEKRQIDRLLVRSSAQTVQVKLPGNRVASQQFLETPIRLKRGSRLLIRAKGTVTLTNWGQASGPAGNPNCGSHFPGIPVGAVAGRIGTSGQLFLVGDHYEETVDRDGTLYLAVAVNQTGVNNTGEFRLEITVEEGR